MTREFYSEWLEKLSPHNNLVLSQIKHENLFSTQIEEVDLYYGYQVAINMRKQFVHGIIYVINIIKINKMID